MGCRLPVTLFLCLALAGCGTTKWTDTGRSATEQLLISNAMDRAVSRLDFRALAGKKVYLDAKPLQSATDSAYLVSSLRQHMLACGCFMMDAQAEADYIVEARSGAVGTDHHELVYGIPRVDIPALIPVSGVGIPSNIPELKLITRTDQRAVVKIAVFAYNRETGRPVWQSGMVPVQSDAKAFWVFGAGPFQTGSIYKGTAFAGDKLKIPLIDLEGPQEDADPVSVADEAYFVEPVEGVAQADEDPESGAVTAASAPPDQAKPAEAAAEVIQTTHTQPEAAGAAGTPPPQTPPPAAPQTTPPADQPADGPPEGGPPQPPPVATSPTDAPQPEANSAEAAPGQPPIAASPSPGTVPLTASAVRQPGAQAPAADVWPLDLVPPLPPALHPFD